MMPTSSKDGGAARFRVAGCRVLIPYRNVTGLLTVGQCICIDGLNVYARVAVGVTSSASALTHSLTQSLRSCGGAYDVVVSARSVLD